MPAYDAAWFEPPAPLALVTMRNRETGAVLPDVPMLLDTGADVTLIPQATIGPLGLSALPDRHYEVVGFNGAVSFVPIVQLELVFCRRTFRGQFLVTDQSWGILGRNILNAVTLIFDGPNLAWTDERAR